MYAHHSAGELTIYLVKCLRFSVISLVLTLSAFAADHIAETDFLLEDLSGTPHQLSKYRGKWVIVNYWATWCSPCLEEVPELVALYDDRKGQDVVVLGVVFDYPSVEAVKRYVDDMLMSYPIVLGNASVIQQIGSADVLPTTYLYSPQGKLLKIKRGIVSRRYLETMMR